MAVGGSKTAVAAAIGGNAVVMVAKLFAAFITGSGAMLSEAIHSFADVLNQILLMVGIIRSKKSADQDFQYGYGRERFIWTLMSAVGIFFLGCGVTIYHGVSSLLNPHPIKGFEWAIGVLIFSFVVEASIFLFALRGLRKAAGDKPFMPYLREEADPTAVAVLLEDSAACLGIVLALIGILLTKYTGHLYWDSIATLLIGVLLGFVAMWLIVRNRNLLIGPAIPKDVQERVRRIIESDNVVEKLVELKSKMIDLETYDILAHVDFKGAVLAKDLEPFLKESYGKINNYDDFYAFSGEFADRVVSHLGDEIDDLEAKIQKEIPEAKHLDIEID